MNLCTQRENKHFIRKKGLKMNPKDVWNVEELKSNREEATTQEALEGKSKVNLCQNKKEQFAPF